MALAWSRITFPHDDPSLGVETTTTTSGPLFLSSSSPGYCVLLPARLPRAAASSRFRGQEPSPFRYNKQRICVPKKCHGTRNSNKHEINQLVPFANLTDVPNMKAKQPQFPQPPLIRFVLQTLHQLRCPSLDTLQHLNVSLVVRGPKLNTVFEDPALGLVEPHTIGPSPSIQPVQVPLWSLPTLKQINAPAQLGVVCKLTEGALDPLFQISDKDIKQNWPQHRAPGNSTCDRPPTGFNSIHHHSLGPAIQPVLYPKSAERARQEDDNLQIILKERCSIPLIIFMALLWTRSQQVHAFPVLRTPELDAVLQVGSHQRRVQGQNHLPRPAGHTSFDAAQDTVGLLGCEYTLPAHVQLFIHPYPKATLKPFIPQPVLIPGVVLTHGRTLHMALLNLMRFTWAHFSSLSRSLWMASCASEAICTIYHLNQFIKAQQKEVPTRGTRNTFTVALSEVRTSRARPVQPV
ncbi:hypothetical protein QYF61_008690 [Mycteria americana]|uniref:Uncharacterized protein n=1 Tax=Mycteria americana TaxID=33587 RepID=A0AAN7PHU0_MYCAM|nr:hypothetical protein QYF61_008690 [Mycteria americana]